MGPAEKNNGSGQLRQLVSFQLGDEEFGIDILAVQEINRMLEITKIPEAPAAFEGVINLRGRVIPVLNLRKKFGLPEKEKDKSTRIMVVNVREKVFGLIVDAVSEVLRLPAGSVEPPPSAAFGIDSEYISGVGKTDKKLLILLDLDKLIRAQDERVLEGAAT